MRAIKESAIIYKWITYTWKRHCNCIIKAYKATGDKPIICEQGFIDTNWKFISRLVAGRIAIKSGQIKKLKFSKNKLFSEDLY